MDYIFAVLVLEEIDKHKTINNYIKNNHSIMELLSLMTFPNQGLSVFNTDVFNGIDVYRYKCYAMVNCPKSITPETVKIVKHLMLKNTAEFMAVVNDIILKAARINGHPLSAEFLHSVLSEFETPIEKDLFFALPAKLEGPLGYLRRRDDVTKWDYDSVFRIMNELYRLYPDDKHNGMPLVYAWTLSLLDNGRRTYARNNLYRWSIKNPKEFNKLFVRMKSVNDPQIRADMFSIAMSMSYGIPADCNEIKEISNIIFNDIFVDNKLADNMDIAIRYYSEQICEKAFYGGHLSKEQIDIVRSKKVIHTQMIPLHTGAFSTDRMDSYGEFNYDITRYILCDPITSLFFQRGGASYSLFNSKSEQLLQSYAKNYKVKKLNSSGFIMAAAYQFFINCGYSNSLCEEHHEGGQRYNIAHVNGDATHGSKSKIYSIAEKYARRSKYYLLGYLSDNLFFRIHSTEELEKVERYTDLENFIVPYQEVAELDNGDNEDNTLILPQSLNRLEKPKYDQTERIINYNINGNLLPDLEKFIFISAQYNPTLEVDKNQTTLYQMVKSSDEKLGIHTILWISSGLIATEYFTSLIIDAFCGDNTLITELCHSNGMCSYSETYCYLNPSDICGGKMKSEMNIPINSHNGVNYEIFYTTEKCTASISLKGDKEYTLPSMAMRNNCDIVNGNGYEFFDSQNTKIATFYSFGEGVGDYQDLLTIDSDKIDAYLLRNQLKIFWVCRVLTEATNKAIERLQMKGKFDTKDETFIVWFEDGKFRKLMIDCADKV